MSDRPIIFSAPMVRALLAGRKTQTRRLVSKDLSADARYTGIHYAGDEPDSWFFNSPIGPRKVPVRYEEGDLLYVRENWRVSPEACEGWHPDEVRGWIDYQAGGSLEVVAPSFEAVEKAAFLKTEDHDWDFIPSRYRPCIHMPRWASRLTLIVEGVKVERLQHISEADAVAEGVEPWPFGEWFDAGFCRVPAAKTPPITRFAFLWDSLHQREGAWAANPFVVALTFRVVHGNIDRIGL